MSKEKYYKFDKLGLVQVMYDIKKEKQDKAENVISLGLLLVLFGFGLLSKEFLILYLTSKGAGIVTRFFI